jgi:hypothetical protein
VRSLLIYLLHLMVFLSLAGLDGHAEAHPRLASSKALRANHRISSASYPAIGSSEPTAASHT